MHARTNAQTFHYPTQINVAEGAAADLPDESVLAPDVELRLRRSARARHGATRPDQRRLVQRRGKGMDAIISIAYV